MGVIRDLSTIFGSYDPSIEDALDNLNDDAAQEVTPCRRAKKMKSRNPARPESTRTPLPCKSKGGKKYRRFENANYLESLADSSDLSELTIHDFISDSVSVFAQLITEEEKLQVWNTFISCSEEEQQQFMEELERGRAGCQNGRNVHPAFAADWCFGRIDGDLRSMLRRRHLPLGTLEQLESDINRFFNSNPQSVRHYNLPNSFERLMVHALCQYMDLFSRSYNQEGSRWTKVTNRRPDFHPPEMPLTEYLERKFRKL